MISVKDIVKSIEYLPPFSSTAQRALQLLQDQNSHMKAIAEEIKYDPALTVNVLKVVNSAYFGLGKEVKDVFTAVNYLGRNQLYNIIMISASKLYFPNLMSGYELNQGEIWQGSLSVAVVSEYLHFLEPQLEKEELFTAGLLHDIGKIVLSQYVKNDFNKIQEEVERGTDFISAEKKVLGFTHAEVGGTILKQWKFSENIIAAARYHLNPEAIDNPVVNIVSVAKLITMQLGVTSLKDSMAYKSSYHLLEHYGIDNEKFEQITSETLEIIQKALDKLKD